MTAIAIRRIRKRLGLSQNGFARRLGVARATVTRWENGTCRPSKLVTRALQTDLQIPAGRGWEQMGQAALNDLWDNSADSVYDQWKARYRRAAR